MNEESSVMPSEFRLAYWQLQYDRVAQHENGRYQVSAFISAGSLVALGLVARDETDLSSAIVAAVAVMLVNLLASTYISEERTWVKIHQDRAAFVLERAAPDLVKMQGVINQLHGRGPTARSRRRKTRSSVTLGLVHAVIGLAALGMVVARIL